MDVYVTSSVEREDLWVEISTESQIWAEIHYDPALSRFRLVIFSSSTGEDWNFDLVEALTALERARKRALLLEGLEDAAKEEPPQPSS